MVDKISCKMPIIFKRSTLPRLLPILRPPYFQESSFSFFSNSSNLSLGMKSVSARSANLCSFLMASCLSVSPSLVAVEESKENINMYLTEESQTLFQKLNNA
jgi:hypothetical protein